MGQHQLLLLVLGVVLVGLAVVVGISAFRENQARAKVDRYTTEGITIGTRMITWSQTSETFGGGGGRPDWSRFSLPDIGIPTSQPDATHSIYDHDGYRRAIARSAAPPLIFVHDVPWTVDGAVSVQVGVWGPKAECINHRTGAWNTPGGYFQYYGPELSNPDPARCHW